MVGGVGSERGKRVDPGAENKNEDGALLEGVRECVWFSDARA